MSFDALIAVAATLQALGVFAAVGKAWGWALRLERRLMRIEAQLSINPPETKP